MCSIVRACISAVHGSGRRGRAAAEWFTRFFGKKRSEKKPPQPATRRSAHFFQSSALRPSQGYMEERRRLFSQARICPPSFDRAPRRPYGRRRRRSGAVWKTIQFFKLKTAERPQSKKVSDGYTIIQVTRRPIRVASRRLQPVSRWA